MTAVPEIADIRRLIDKGRLAHAARECRKRMAVGRDAEAMLLLAIVNAERDRYAEALALFEEARRNGLESAEFDYHEGNLLIRLRRRNEALAA